MSGRQALLIICNEGLPVAGDATDTLAHTVDEASHHQDRVKVPQLLRIIFLGPTPGKGKSLPIPSVLDDPVEGQRNHSVQEDLGQEGKDTQAATRPSRHLLVIFSLVRMPAVSGMISGVTLTHME